MVLENVCEMWTEMPKGNRGKKSHPVPRERYVSKMFLRGDSVVLVLRNPKWKNRLNKNNFIKIIKNKIHFFKFLKILHLINILTKNNHNLKFHKF